MYSHFIKSEINHSLKIYKISSQKKYPHLITLPYWLFLKHSTIFINITKNKSKFLKPSILNSLLYQIFNSIKIPSHYLIY
jgi:hypothetical protein